MKLKSAVWVIIVTYILTSVSSSLIDPVEANFILKHLSNGDVRNIGLPIAVGKLFFPLFSIVFCCYCATAKSLIGWSFLFSAAAIPLALLSGNMAAYSLVKIPWVLTAALGGPVMLTILQHQFHNKANFEHLFGYLNAAMALTGALFALIGGWLGQKYLPAPFILLAALFAFIGVMLLISGRRIHEEDHQPTEGIIRSGVELWRSVPLKFFVFYVVTYPILYINMSLRPIIWPQFLSGFSKSSLLVGGLFSSMGLAAFASSFLFGPITKRLGVANVMLGAMACFWLCTAGMVYGATSVPLLYLYAGGIAISESMLMPARMSLIRGHIPKRLLSSFGGFETVVSTIVSGIVLVFFGQVQNLLGISGMFKLVLWVNAATIVVFFLLRDILASCTRFDGGQGENA